MRQIRLNKTNTRTDIRKASSDNKICLNEKGKIWGKDPVLKKRIHNEKVLQK